MTKELNEKGLKQRQDAARLHGVYAFRDRGPSALQAEERGTYAALQDQLSTRPGAIEALQEQATQTMLLAEIAQSYCVRQHRAGVDLDKIALFRSLPAFWNSANRALKTYLDVIPDDSMPESAEIIHIQEMIKEHDKENAK